TNDSSARKYLTAPRRRVKQSAEKNFANFRRNNCAMRRKHGGEWGSSAWEVAVQSLLGLCFAGFAK
ncbi:MAG: hypothetical protein MPK05_08100, partial [Gammaproteobacteria bacterium]|nr:hypothetical protein [Gammaproteobacteria bacterium]